MNSHISRRRFLIKSSQSAALLTVSFSLSAKSRAAIAPSESAGMNSGFSPNAWLSIHSDNSVTIMSSAGEMGQGSFTSLPMMIAEEMELDPAQVNIEHAPVGQAYINKFFNFQATGGSTSVRSMFDHLRQIGADTRELMIQAAAKHWDIDKDKISAAAGQLKHPDGQTLSYADAVPYTQGIEMPSGTALKAPSEWRILGRSFKRKDTPDKVAGTAEFGTDVKLDGLLIAVIKACPTFGGTLVSVDPEPAMAVKGVAHVVPLKNAVAVCAKDYWAAQKGLKALQPVWDLGTNEGTSTDSIRQKMLLSLEQPGIEALKQGDLQKVKEQTQKTHSVTYEAPYLAHATMEPMNATVDATTEKVRVWAPAQSIARVQWAVAGVLQTSPENVEANSTFMGGGFGRKASPDAVVQAALISRQVVKPIKLIWSREEDMTGAFYRPMSLMNMNAYLDKDGKTRGLEIRVANQSILRMRDPDVQQDPTSVEGLVDTDYAFDAAYADYHMSDQIMPVWFWRSVGYSQNSWAMESYVDELAGLENVDPYQWRRARLSSNERKRDVLDKAAQEANWGKAAEGRVQGMAIVGSFGSLVAQVIEAEIDDDNRIKIEKVTCVVDCGLAIDPGAIKAQMEGSIVYGLTAAMYGKVDIVNGAAAQSNFPQYEMMRMRHMPVVDVHILESTGVPGGIGEPGLPPAAPALCNAIYAATGKPIHKLPLMEHGFSFA